MKLTQIFNYHLLVDYENVILFSSIVLFLLLGKKVISNLVLKFFHAITKRLNLNVTLLDFFRQPTVFSIISFCIFVNYNIFLTPYHTKLDFIVLKLVEVAKILACFWFGYNFLAFFVPHVIKSKKVKNNNILQNNVIVLLLKTGRIILGVFAVIAILKVFGVNLIGLLAGLGLAGIAFALAAQDTLKNLFSSITIILDNVFVEGDYIKIDNIEGKIEYIGFRSTIIRTNNQSLVFIPNSKFSDSIVTNISKIPYTNLSVSIVIKRPIKKDVLDSLVKDIKKYVANHKEFVKDEQIISTKALNNLGVEILCQFVLKIVDEKAITLLKGQIVENLSDLFDNSKVEVNSITCHHQN